MPINKTGNHGLSSIAVEEDLGIAVDSQTGFFSKNEKNDGKLEWVHHYVRGCCQKEENKLSFMSIVDRIVIIKCIKGRKK